MNVYWKFCAFLPSYNRIRFCSFNSRQSWQLDLPTGFTLFQDIALKPLLYEAHTKGAQELLYVVPFVAKVLESVGKSRVFKLPNPWTEALMSVLKELHMEPDLKVR